MLLTQTAIDQPVAHAGQGFARHEFLAAAVQDRPAALRRALHQHEVLGAVAAR
jgi:hypothetical protein